MNNTQTKSSWTSTGVYLMAAVCLLIGFVVGYFIRGPVQPAATATAAVAAQQQAANPAQQQVSPEMMKHMADKKAESLLEQLKSDPKNAHLLAEIGNIYYDTQTYNEAILYYQRSLAIKEDPNVRTDLGTAIFYTGDADTALREFQKALKSNPKHANALFNTGMVKWQGKMDVEGAIAAWQTFLKMNPNHPRKGEIEELIARARQHENVKPGQKSNKPIM